MEIIEPSLFSVVNSSFAKTVGKESPVKQKYYNAFLKWSDNKDELENLSEEEGLAYKILCRVFDAISLIINDTLITRYEKTYNKRIVEWRFANLQEAMNDFIREYENGLFKKEDAQIILDDFIATFDKQNLADEGKNTYAAGNIKWEQAIKYEVGLINDESIFNRIYWILKETKDKL